MDANETPQTTAAAWREAAAPLRHHVGRTVALALPVMAARAGALIMITADVIMTGHVGATELAYYGMGFAPAQNLFTIGLGYLIGAMVLTAQAEGQGRQAGCGTIWYVAMGHGLAAGLLFLALAFGGEWFFLLMGQTPDLARGGAGVLRMFAWGLPGMMLYVATSHFLVGLSRPKPNMVLMVGANLVNVGLNWLLIYDHPWMEGMGAQGAALATSITRWLMWLGLAAYVLLMPGARRWGVGGPLHQPRDVSRKLMRIGLPVGLQHGLEASAFTAIAMFAGLLGAVPLATYQIVQNLFVTVYMLAIGMATATGVRVGNAVGRAARVEMAWAGWTGIGMSLAVLLPVFAAFQLLAGPLAGIYTSDAAVLAPAYAAIAVVSAFVVVDGLQGVTAGALRGAGDVWVPAMMVTGGFWGVSVPLGYYTAFTLGWGVDGLLWGLAAGALAATVPLLARFHVVSRRVVATL